jgi:two-component system response regulator FlrC
VERHELELAVAATQAGAAAVVAWQDIRHDTWQQMHDKLMQNPAPAVSARRIRHVVFVDPASQHLLALAQKVAQAEVTALLVGPTGAGKEVLARVLHEASPRARGPFVALNCAAMPENLIEDMLFGHEKGAFTGAHREHKGLFEQAQGGTLFLDEIGEMPMHLQSKLLRVLQEKQLTRLGGQTLIALNVRVVAATNKDLRRAIEERQFREDLYYRIATFRMRLLPLKDRPGDIIPLAVQSLVQNDPCGKAWQIQPEAQAQLLQYPWPGNVRELENVMRRALVLCPDHVVTPAHLMFDDWLTEEHSPEGLPHAPERLPVSTADPVTPALPAAATPWQAPPAPVPVVHTAQDLHSASRMNEHQVIMATLATTPSKLEAAKRLGISPRTLRYKLAQLREHGLGMATAN